MKQIRDSYKKTGNLHHAYALLGDRAEIKRKLLTFLEKDLSFPIIGNPDFWQEEFNVFKIIDSRALNSAHQKKPVKYERKIFLVLANFITKDAQNSLLKIFEEPTGEATFFLIFPETIDLLPTLKSRMIIIKEKNNKTIINKKNGETVNAEDFLNAKVGRRLQMTTKIAKDIKDEKMTKSEAVSFIKDIEKVIKKDLKLKNAHNAKSGSLLAIEDIEKAISYAGDESPSIKVILDHLALVL